LFYVKDQQKNRPVQGGFFYVNLFYLSILSHPKTNSNNAINNNGLANYGLFGSYKHI